MAEHRAKVLHLAAADSMLNPNLRDQLLFLRGRGWDVHTASIDGPLARKLRDEDRLPWTPVPLTREIAPWADLRARRWLEGFFREQQFEIVHTHTPKGNVVGQWAARRAGVPVVLQTLHGFYFHDLMPWWKRRLWISIERFSARRSHHILCQNSEDVETAVREGIAPREKITLLGNGIDLARFRPDVLDPDSRANKRKELGIPEDALVVGMCGRFVGEKGYPELLAAGRILAAQFPRLHLLVAGHRSESERARDRWDPAGADFPTERLSVLTDRDDMHELYAIMDVNVLASHREGFPRVLMEGAASGLAQVATDIRGCRQAVAEGETGFLVPPRNAQALAEGIERLLADPELRRKMSAAARTKAEREFDRDKVFAIVEATYEKLLKRNAKDA